MNRKQGLILFVVLLALSISVSVVVAQGPAPTGARVPSVQVGTAFTYQGQLKNSGTPVNATCNFQFGLWDSASGGLQVSGTTTQTVSSVSVSNGLFTAAINFGASVINGEARYLAIAVQCPTGGTLTPLTTRQALTPVPYALYSSGNWGLSGNVGISSTLNFIGTTDNQPLVFKTNNAEGLRIDPVGNIGIGTTMPSDKLTIQGGNVRTTAAFVSEGFEGVSFPPASWTTGGNANWTRDTSQFASGAASAASGSIGDNQSTYLEIDYTFPRAGFVRFNWKVSSEQGWDFLMFCLDNNACTRTSGYNQRITGNVNWTQVSVAVAAGAHTFRWVYAKDSVQSAGSDKGWLDDVRLTDNSGNVLTSGDVVVDGGMSVGSNTGLGTTASTRRLEVNGVVGVFDSGIRTLNAGVATEAGSTLIDVGINDGTGNRFGGTYTSTQQGGFLRVESRPAYPLFGFFARPAGTSGDAAQLGYINSNGTVRFEIGPSQKFSLGGSGTFEIDAPGIIAGRFIVQNDGKVGIGVPSPTYRLQLPNTADAMGQGQANAWQTYSSRRYKSNIVTIENALDKVEHLRGVTFDWKQNGKHDLGLIAEEVGAVIPEIVNYENNGVDAQSLDYSRLVAVLIEATKEQQQQIELQRDQIATLQREEDSQLAALRQQNAALEARLSALEQKTQVQSTPAPVVSFDLVSSLFNGNLLSVLALLVGAVMFYRGRK